MVFLSGVTWIIFVVLPYVLTLYLGRISGKCMIQVQDKQIYQTKELYSWVNILTPSDFLFATSSSFPLMTYQIYCIYDMQESNSFLRTDILDQTYGIEMWKYFQQIIHCEFVSIGWITSNGNAYTIFQDVKLPHAFTCRYCIYLIIDQVVCADDVCPYST